MIYYFTTTFKDCAKFLVTTPVFALLGITSGTEHKHPAV